MVAIIFFHVRAIIADVLAAHVIGPLGRMIFHAVVDLPCPADSIAGLQELRTQPFADRLVLFPKVAVFVATRLPGTTTTHQRCSRWFAGWHDGVCIGKADTTCRQAIKVWRPSLRIAVQMPNPVIQVVHRDHQHIGAIGSRGRSRMERQQQTHQQKDCFGKHVCREDCFAKHDAVMNEEEVWSGKPVKRLPEARGYEASRESATFVTRAATATPTMTRSIGRPFYSSCFYCNENHRIQSLSSRLAVEGRQL